MPTIIVGMLIFALGAVFGPSERRAMQAQRRILAEQARLELREDHDLRRDCELRKQIQAYETDTPINAVEECR